MYMHIFLISMLHINHNITRMCIYIYSTHIPAQDYYTWVWALRIFGTTARKISQSLAFLLHITKTVKKKPGKISKHKIGKEWHTHTHAYTYTHAHTHTHAYTRVHTICATKLPHELKLTTTWTKIDQIHFDPLACLQRRHTHTTREWLNLCKSYLSKPVHLPLISLQILN